MSKSKVKPTKAISIPRLELMACLVGIRLVQFVKTSLHLSCPTKFYSDSMVALGWIKSPAKNWKSFIANRVEEIQQHAKPSDWIYVSTDENPENLPTKGISATKIND